MSERPDDIDARLRQLAGSDEAAAGGRVVARAADGAEAVTRALLNAIDETVLPAQLTLASEADGSIVLAVAGRRLRAVLAASDGLAPGDAVGATLDGDDAEAVAGAAALLNRFARSASGSVIVRESRTTEGGSGGVSANRLAELMPEDAGPEETAARSDADRFLSLCGGRVAASLVRGTDGADRAAGNPDLAETLAGMAGLEADGTAPALSLWMRQTGPADGGAFGRAVFADGSLAVIAVTAADAAALTAAFREIGAA